MTIDYYSKDISHDADTSYDAGPQVAVVICMQLKYIITGGGDGD